MQKGGVKYTELLWLSEMAESRISERVFDTLHAHFCKRFGIFRISRKMAPEMSQIIIIYFSNQIQ